VVGVALANHPVFTEIEDVYNWPGGKQVLSFEKHSYLLRQHWNIKTQWQK